MGYAQGTVLALFYLFSVEYGYKLSRQLYGDSGQAKRGWIPIFLFLTSTTLVFLWLFLY
jgi:hypothetical protein